LKNNHNDFKAISDGKCEVLVISREKYNDIIKENEDKLKDAKMNTISRNLLRFKKMDRTLKENNLKYFKSEKFSKGDVIVNLKSKIEELYLIEKGRVALVVSAPKQEERLRSPLESSGSRSEGKETKRKDT